MKISEVVQYQHVADKGPKTPEQLAAINAQRAASGQQAADIAAHQSQMANGLYAQPAATTAPTPATPQLPTNQSWQQLYAANKDVIGANPSLIKPGQQLKMPDGSTYTVKSGDTLSKIATSVKPATTEPQALQQPAASKIVTPITPAPAAQPTTLPQNPGQQSNYYVQPSKVGMDGEMDYVVVDRERGLEVNSFNSQAEADAWIKSQPVSESLDRLLTIAGIK